MTTSDDTPPVDELDFKARYSVATMPGIAFYLTGYVTETQRGVEQYDECIDYWEEEVEDRTRVKAIMVGDDYTHIVDVEDLIKLDDLDYCSECGQIGCAHDGRDRD